MLTSYVSYYSLQMTARQDTDIRLDIENEIVWDTRIISNNIGIEVNSGKVFLEGEVAFIRERKAAEQDSWSVLGVVDVNNEIKILKKYEPQNTSTLNDKLIRMNLRERFNWDSKLNASKIDIEVNKGVAELTGSTDLLWKKDWAEILTENTLGVVRVNNLIKVTPSEDVTDEIILNEIMESLTRKLVPEYLNDIKIIVNNGTVSFEGLVLNDRIWNLLLKTAGITSGVVKIENKLRLISNNK